MPALVLGTAHAYCSGGVYIVMGSKHMGADVNFPGPMPRAQSWGLQRRSRCCMPST